jgi:hypothetical protein
MSMSTLIIMDHSQRSIPNKLIYKIIFYRSIDNMSMSTLIIMDHIQRSIPNKLIYKIIFYRSIDNMSMSTLTMNHKLKFIVYINTTNYKLHTTLILSLQHDIYDISSHFVPAEPLDVSSFNP